MIESKKIIDIQHNIKNENKSTKNNSLITILINFPDFLIYINY